MIEAHWGSMNLVWKILLNVLVLELVRDIHYETWYQKLWKTSGHDTGQEYELYDT